MKPYAKLRGKLAELEIRHQELAEQLGKTQPYVTSRLCGRQRWTIDEAYIVMRYLDIPLDQIFDYFPPGGYADSKSAKPDKKVLEPLPFPKQEQNKASARWVLR